MTRSGNAPSTSSSTTAWPITWLTPYSGLSSASASALAAEAPTVRGPTSPGPAVTAIASTAPSETSAVASARSIVGTMASRWARDAISGMIPPNRACSSTELATASTSRS